MPAIPRRVACALAVPLLALAGCGGDDTSATTAGATAPVREAAPSVVLHGVAVTWVNIGAKAWTVNDDLGRHVLQKGDERVTFGGNADGVDIVGNVSNDCEDWGAGKVSRSANFEGYNPTVGYPRLTFPQTGDTAGYDVGESRPQGLATVGMYVTVTRKPDWYFNDNWGWMKHFRVEGTAGESC